MWSDAIKDFSVNYSDFGRQDFRKTAFPVTDAEGLSPSCSTPSLCYFLQDFTVNHKKASVSYKKQLLNLRN